MDRTSISHLASKISATENLACFAYLQQEITIGKQTIYCTEVIREKIGMVGLVWGGGLEGLGS